MRLLFIYGLIFLQILFGSSKVGIAVKMAGEVKLFFFRDKRRNLFKSGETP